MDGLAERLYERQGRPPAPPEARAPLQAHLAQVLEEARGAWPDVDLDPGAFIDHLADRVDPESPAVSSLQRLITVDLYLACACARDRPGAIAAFERTFASELRRAFTRSKARGIDADDLQQHLRERLFVERDGRPARIASYTGEGSLRAWVRVAATRLRIDVERRRWDRQTDLPTSKADAIADVAHGDLELAYLQANYREAFTRAFEAALEQLAPRERNLLRLNVLHGVSGTAIATMYGVHRATAKRWLAAARGGLLRHTRQHLQQKLRLDSGELDSVMGLVHSRLDLSIGRMLGTIEADPDDDPDDPS